MTYDGMNVANGNEASNRYLKFIQGKLSEQEISELFKGLDKYCEQDTLAMVRLLEVLEGKEV